MKKTFKYIAVLFLTILVSSCGNDWLDLEKDDSFPMKEVKTAHLFDMRVGMYDAIQNSSEYYGAKMIYDGDVRGDDFQYKKETSSRADDSYLYSYALNNAVGCWEHAYYLIRTANQIIEAQPIDAEQGTNKVKIDDIKGQAYVLRALAHFDVLRNYGEFYDIDSKWGIPIIDNTIPEKIIETNKPKRSTVRQVYAHILEDLVGPGKALELLPNTDKIDPGYVNKWTAKALLCRVYLYMGLNQECLDVANDIITNAPHKLWKTEDYLSSWSKKGHSESLFEVLNTSEDNLGREGIGYLMYPSGGYGYGDIIATLQYINLFEPGDVRKGLFHEKYYMHKYPGILMSSSGDRLDNSTTSIQVLRLSEVYLNAAEAAQKLGNSQADQLLTTIVQRANPAAPVVSGANLERVLLERRKELGGEGFRFYDALRNNKTMYRDDINGYMAEVNASGIIISVPEGLEDSNAALHPTLSLEHTVISRNHKKIIYPIPAREINVINTHGEVIEQYYKW